VAPSASVIAEVELFENATVWNNAVVRGDLNAIQIGANSHVMDNCVLTTASSLPTGVPARMEIGMNCVIQPNCTLTSCFIGNNVMIGSNTVVMEGCKIEDGVRIESGSVLPPGT